MTSTALRGCAVLALGSLVMLSACGKGRETRHRGGELDCMQRAMYFESNRSSRDGMVAVGSVVMNRVASDDFPNTVCGVVGQKNQFAPGIMTKDMTETRSMARVAEAAGAVLRGERHPRIENARFFHVASYRAGYDNMHYVLTTGGNAFYEKRDPTRVTRPEPPAVTEGLTPARPPLGAIIATRG